MTKRDTLQHTTDDQGEQNEKLRTWEEFGDTVRKLLLGSQEMRRRERARKESPKNR